MKKWIGLLIGIVLLAAVLFVHHGVVESALAALPETALASAPPTVSVKTFSELTKVKNVSPVLSLPGNLQGRSVTIHYTTADATEIFGIPMLYGSFVPWEEADIVIDRRMAAELFMTENAVGQTVSLNGREYIVRGVSAPQDDLIARISRTTEPEVWLPLAAYPDQEEGIGEYLVSLHTGLKGSVHYARIAPELEAKLGVGLTFRSAYNFDEARRLARQSESVYRLLLLLAFCAVCAYAVLLQAIELVKAVRADEDRTWLRALADRWRKTLALFISLLILAGGAYWVSRSGFRLFLPQDYISDSRGIVDFIVKSFQLTNMRSDMFLCAYSSHVMTVLALLDLLTIVLLLKVVYRGIRVVKELLERH